MRELIGHNPGAEAKPGLTENFDHVKRTKREPLSGRKDISVEQVEYGKFRGGKLNVYCAKSNEIDPEANPVIVFPGFIGNGSKVVSGHFAEALAAELKTEVYAIAETGYRRRGHDMQPHSFQPPKGGVADVPVIDLETAELAEWLMGQKDLKDKGNVDLVAQSAGVGPAVITATGNQAGRIDNIYGAEMAMHEPMGAAAGLGQFSLMAVKESIHTLRKFKASRPDVNRSTRATVAAIPTHFLRLANQINRIAESDYGPVVAGLQNLGGSPKIIVETAGRDTMFGEPAGGVDPDKVVPDRGHNVLPYHPEEEAGRVAESLRKSSKTPEGTS
jgi:hypothetical protein